MQNNPGEEIPPAGMSEDCLSLSIWTPQASLSHRLPVMAWIHGGGFTTGSGASPVYNGERLAREQGVIVVTLQYRLGMFGMLVRPEFEAEYGASGGMNFLHDQIGALSWIQKHIAAFGEGNK